MCVFKPKNLETTFLSDAPYNQASVFRAADEVASIRTKRKLPDSLLMPVESVKTYPVLQALLVAPTLDRIIVAGTVKNVLLRVPYHEFHVLRMPRKHAHAAEVVFILITLPYPNGFVA